MQQDTEGGVDQRAYDPTAVAAAMQLSRFERQRVLIEGSRLSSPFQGESRYSIFKELF